jgi:hypothetical protein
MPAVTLGMQQPQRGRTPQALKTAPGVTTE